MENITIITDTDNITGAVTETVLIDHGNGSFTSMLKSAYDEQQEHLQTIVPQVTE